jgi:formate hydrogenlyase subunit 6/NADH:ubiquinone oxidoreductase subunit I
VPQVTIDSTKVTVAEGATVLDAARSAGIWVPTLCRNPAVRSLGVCRICMVEVWQKQEDPRQRGRMVSACTHAVRDGLTVSVAGARATRARRGVMELLLARAPGSPELRALAGRMGVDGTPYPTVTEAQRNCVLCGLCIAVCEQVIGASAIGFAGRGVARAVSGPFGEPSPACIACAACAAVCPVGTIEVVIHPESDEVEIAPFGSRSKLQRCAECGGPVAAAALARSADQRVGLDWEELRSLARLCPECRRKRAAAARALTAVDAIASGAWQGD